MVGNHSFFSKLLFIVSANYLSYGGGSRVTPKIKEGRTLANFLKLERARERERGRQRETQKRERQRRHRKRHRERHRERHRV